jgi:5-oxoprolinase (ATP-hydrolysing)
MQVLEQQGRSALQLQGLIAEQIRSEWQVALRFAGTDTSLNVAYAEKSTMQADFQVKYRQQFGFCYQDRSLLISSIQVECIGLEHKGVTAKPLHTENRSGLAESFTQVFSGNSWHETPVYRREQLLIGKAISGPAIVIEATSTIVIEPGWQGCLNSDGNLLLQRLANQQAECVLSTKADPVLLEIFNKRFMSIAEQMGFVLQNTAHSVNIKERLDFSCAIFDAAGQLVTNAPHIPVHLGSMGDSVLALLQDFGDQLKPGDAYLLNSPYAGGTHLPDITVVTPVFAADGYTLLFFTAARGHHADVGGISPGSMPAHSRHIDEEGVISAGLKILEAGVFQEVAIREWLHSNPHPARNPEQNLADLQAQIAANQKGARELLLMVEAYSLPVVLAYMQHVQDHAAACVRQALAGLKEGCFAYRLDQGANIVVRISIDRELQKACIDFTGTSLQLGDNFNAPKAVCKAAVLYVFRTLVADDIPLNAGCLQPLDIIIPEGSLLNPRYPAAVVAGNVETSQYIVDALYAALGVLAGSQGTMNNLTFGNQHYQYYETLCGGAGAGKGFKGAGAVHTHMTNSRLTDPEILEWRFPVLLREFSIRADSGGVGRNQGGNGVLRRLEFRKAMTAGILSSHRLYPPIGLHGGLPGKTGVNSIIRRDGAIERLCGCAEIQVEAGDVLIIETPGGGGYGVDPKNGS